MKIVKASSELVLNIEPQEMLDNIERCARVCYKSDIARKGHDQKHFIKQLINSGHESVLEHATFSVKFIVDRGVSHELVRHRIASYSQESTRYCNYSNEKFNNEITVIKPCFFNEGTDQYSTWKYACECSEKAYMILIANGAKPEEARTVLPNSLKTEIIMTTNVREWRHFLLLRAQGITGKPHSQMLEVTTQLLDTLHMTMPILFEDIHALK